MNTTIDGAGRLVIPRAIRERAQLAAGGTVEVVEHNGVIEIRAAPAEIEIRDTAEGAVAVPTAPTPPLTDELVLDTLDHLRR